MSTAPALPWPEPQTEAEAPVPLTLVPPSPAPRFETHQPQQRLLHMVPTAAPSGRSVPAAAARAARAAAQGLVEALAGIRPCAHLAPLCDLDSFEKITRRVRWEREAQAAGTGPRPTEGQKAGSGPRALHVLGCHYQLVNDAVEASTTFAVGSRVRALGFRMEGHRGRWRIVALEVG